METRQKYQTEKLSLNLSISSTPIEQVSEHCLTGVIVDEQLMWQTHINNIYRTVFINIFLLSKLKQITSHKAKSAFFFAHIMRM